MHNERQENIDIVLWKREQNTSYSQHSRSKLIDKRFPRVSSSRRTLVVPCWTDFFYSSKFSGKNKAESIIDGRWTKNETKINLSNVVGDNRKGQLWSDNRVDQCHEDLLKVGHSKSNTRSKTMSQISKNSYSTQQMNSR